MTWLLVALGAAVGAPLRYLTDRALRARCGPDLPWGTLAVNVVGSLVLGTLTGLVGPDPDGGVAQGAQALLGSGLCGALTTYSTFAYETVDLARRGRLLPALGNAVVTPTAGLAAVVLGLLLGQRV